METVIALALMFAVLGFIVWQATKSSPKGPSAPPQDDPTDTPNRRQ